MKYLYFPGCSLKGTGRAYEESILAVFKAIKIDLTELDDWNCCGATAYMGVDATKAYALAARNLAIAERESLDLVAPCSACYLGLSKTQHAMAEDPAMRTRVLTALKAAGLDYKGTVRIRHPLDVLVNDVGLKNLAPLLRKPLTGLKIAPYYGCQIVRPYSTFDDQDRPVTMDHLLEACGAETVPFPIKTWCCGGSLTGTLPEVGLRLSYNIIKEAMRRKADAIVTVCPLCQFNLDAYQDKMTSEFEKVSMPTLYFTQILGLAMGLDAKELGINRGIISAEAVLAR